MRGFKTLLSTAVLAAGILGTPGFAESSSAGTSHSGPQTQPQTHTLTPSTAPVLLPEAMTQAHYKVSALSFQDHGGHRVPGLPVLGRWITEDQVFSLTPWELKAALETLTGQKFTLNQILGWTDPQVFRIFVNPVSEERGPAKEPPQILFLGPDAPKKDPLTLEKVPGLRDWYHLDLLALGLKPGAPLEFQIKHRGQNLGQPQKRRSTAWYYFDKQGKFAPPADTYPGVLPEDYLQAQRLRTTGLLAQEIRNFIRSAQDHGAPQIHAAAPAHEDPFSPKTIRWWPGEIQKLNTYKEWYMTLEKGPGLYRNIIFRDIPGLSPLEIQEALHQLTGEDIPLEDVMDRENLERYRFKLLGFQAYALKYELEAEGLKDVSLDLILEEMLATGGKAPQAVPGPAHH